MNRRVNISTKINDWVAKVEAFFLCLFLFEMFVLAFFQVVMRNVFNNGIPWADTVVRLSVLWVGFLGASVATRLDQNLTLEVLTKYMPERIRHLSAVLVKLFAVMACYFLLMASFRFLGDERSTGEQFLHLFPSWWTLTIIPAAFILIPFHLFFSMGRDVRYFVKGKGS